jgi:hypothetical protein
LREDRKGDSTPNRTQDVDRFMRELKHPLKEGVERLRSAILESNDRITEHIKWNAPSFCHAGEDRVTFRLYPVQPLVALLAAVSGGVHKEARSKFSSSAAAEKGKERSV